MQDIFGCGLSECKGPAAAGFLAENDHVGEIHATCFHGLLVDRRFAIYAAGGENVLDGTVNDLWRRKRQISRIILFFFCKEGGREEWSVSHAP